MKMMRVNLSEESIQLTTISEDYRYLGGRALTSKILFDEVPADCDPLGELNKVIIAPGLLGGTSAPCSGRLSIGAKSPLTGGIKEANSGGTAARKLVNLGIKAIIIEGKAPNDRWYVIKLDNDNALLVDGGQLVGLGNYQACRKICQTYGGKVGIIIAGPAAEKRYPMATIAISDTDGNPARHAARGGLGSVMASKGLKAIVIDDTGYHKTEPSPEFNMISRKWARKLVEERTALTKQGTANILVAVNEIGALPTRNFSLGFFEKAENISGDKLAKILKDRGGKVSHACQFGCPIRCSNVYVDKNGDHITSSLEYETIAMNGSNLGIDDLDFIAKIDRFCDDFGIDTIELGGTIGVAMDAGLIPFGDKHGVSSLLKEIRKGSVCGQILLQGVATTGKVFGVQRIPSVKGQGLPAYDPRGFKGTGVTYATSPMGADHTAGNCLIGRLGYRPTTQTALDTKDNRGQVDMSYDLQVMSAVCDALGLCIFVGTNLDTIQTSASLLSILLKQDYYKEDVLMLGINTLKVELGFNSKAGLTVIQNRLPEFFRTDILSPNECVFDVQQSEMDNIFTIGVDGIAVIS